MKIKKFIKKITPKPVLRVRRRWLNNRNGRKMLSKYQAVVNYLETLPPSELDEEKRQVLAFIKKHDTPCVFPYEYTQKYAQRKTPVYRDANRGMCYVLHNGKPLYFPRDWDTIKCEGYYNGLCCEQDPESPHCYETADFCIAQGDVMADLGAAEGILALDAAERASHLYIFETEAHWIEALEATFAPYRDKVTIVNKYVGDTDGDGYVTLDTFFDGLRLDFIKADIEGAELAMMAGAKGILARSTPLKMALCAYHRQDDAAALHKILTDNGFQAEFSQGYMIFLYDKDLRPPYLRRGLIRARR